jgi:hypothetical protein
MTNKQTQTTSEDTKTIATVLLLIFMFPVGIILMWFWTKWKIWVKLLITLPAIIFLISFFSVFFLVFRKISVLEKQTPGLSKIMENQSGNFFSLDDTKEVLDQINSTRVNKGLDPIALDPFVCTFVDEMSKTIRNSGNKVAETQYQSAIKNPETQFKYFANYKYLYHSVLATEESDNAKIANVLVSNRTSNALNPELTSGCVSGSISKDETKWNVVLIGGSKKQ